jgi:hypothetical protein
VYSLLLWTSSRMSLSDLLLCLIETHLCWDPLTGSWIKIWSADVGFRLMIPQWQISHVWRCQSSGRWRGRLGLGQVRWDIRAQYYTWFSGLSRTLMRACTREVKAFCNLMSCTPSVAPLNRWPGGELSRYYTLCIIREPFICLCISTHWLFCAVLKSYLVSRLSSFQ